MTDFKAFPFFDNEAVQNFYKSNFSAAVEAQTVMMDAAQALVSRQFDLGREMVKAAEDVSTKVDFTKKPEAYAEDIKQAAEKAQEIMKSEVETSLQFQQKVSGIVAKQVAANVDELKKFAA